MRFSFFSTRAAQEAQVIPPMVSSICDSARGPAARDPACDAGSPGGPAVVLVPVPVFVPVSVPVVVLVLVVLLVMSCSQERTGPYGASISWSVRPGVEWGRRTSGLAA